MGHVAAYTPGNANEGTRESLNASLTSLDSLYWNIEHPRSLLRPSTGSFANVAHALIISLCVCISDLHSGRPLPCSEMPKTTSSLVPWYAPDVGYKRKLSRSVALSQDCRSLPFCPLSFYLTHPWTHAVNRLAFYLGFFIGLVGCVLTFQ